ncbi:MAG: hypothetical protein AAF598_21785, partial [Bacteroidota bacterium]
MKSLYSILFILCFLSGEAICQRGDVVLLYSNVNDGVLFKQNGTSKRVFAGSSLPADGKLVLGKGEQVSILFKGKKKELIGPKNYQLDEVCEALASKKEKGFFGKFWSYLSNSVGKGSKQEDLEKYDKSLASVNAATKGWGKETGIYAPIYQTEILGNEKVNFHWRSKENFDDYTFLIQHESGDTIVMMELVNAAVTIDMSALNLDWEEVYQWTVLGHLSDDIVRMETIPFYYDPADIRSFKQKVKNLDQMKDLSSTEQRLFTIYSLIEEAYYHQAYTAF